MLMHACAVLEEAENERSGMRLERIAMMNSVRQCPTPLGLICSSRALKRNYQDESQRVESNKAATQRGSLRFYWHY